jgi:hypothetical protein
MKQLSSLLLFCTTALLAASTVSPAPSSNSLVVYNSNIGLVFEKRDATLDKGINELIFPNVARKINMSSISLSLPGESALMMQQYRYDKITLNKMLEASIGENINYYTYNENKRSQKKQGVLLAHHPILIKNRDNVVANVLERDIVFDNVPTRLLTKPSLIWTIDTKEAVEGSMEISYLISSIGWSANYVLNLKSEKKANLLGFITINNNSGKHYVDTKLTVLAGSVNRVQEHEVMADNNIMYKQRTLMARSAPKHIAVSGYHAYEVPFNVTLANNEETQVKLVSKNDLDIVKKYRVRVSDVRYTTEQKYNVKQYVTFKNTKNPLPAGIVRTYQKMQSTTFLLGESQLKHTPKNSDVELLLGENFDLKVKAKMTRNNDDNRKMKRSLEYTLENHSDTKKTLQINIPFVKNARDSLTHSFPNATWKNASLLSADVVLKANSERKFTLNFIKSK